MDDERYSLHFTIQDAENLSCVCAPPPVHFVADIAVHKQLSKIESFDRAQACRTYCPRCRLICLEHVRGGTRMGTNHLSLSDILFRDIMNN